MNAADILKYGHLTVLQSIDSFPESAWDTPGACGVWSAKDIIAHLTSYEHVIGDILTTFVGGDPTPSLALFLESGGQFNDSEVAGRKGKSVGEDVTAYNSSHYNVFSPSASNLMHYILIT